MTQFNRMETALFLWVRKTMLKLQEHMVCRTRLLREDLHTVISTRRNHNNKCTSSLFNKKPLWNTNINPWIRVNHSNFNNVSNSNSILLTKVILHIKTNSKFICHNNNSNHHSKSKMGTNNIQMIFKTFTMMHRWQRIWISEEWMKVILVQFMFSKTIDRNREHRWRISLSKNSTFSECELVIIHLRSCRIPNKCIHNSLFLSKHTHHNHKLDQKINHIDNQQVQGWWVYHHHKSRMIFKWEKLHRLLTIRKSLGKQVFGLLKLLICISMYLHTLNWYHNNTLSMNIRSSKWFRIDTIRLFKNMTI